MSAFRRHGDRIRWELEGFEERLLRDLHEGLEQALAQPDARDPILERLFPATVVGDDEADQEVRRLIHDDLLASRRAGLQALLELLDRATTKGGRLRLDLAQDEPALVLGVLNDIRLALGARIGIEKLDREELTEDDPRAMTVAVIDHLAWMQEQLLAILDPPSVEGS